MRKNTNPAYPDWNNPQAIIVVADGRNPKKVCCQPYAFSSSDLCKCEIEFYTNCDFYSDFFNTKTAEEKRFLDKGCGRKLAWDRAIEVAEMLYLKNVLARRDYERYVVYFQPSHKDGWHGEAVCICSVINSEPSGDNDEC